MPSIVIDSCDDRPYGPTSTDYEYDKLRDEKERAVSQISMIILDAQQVLKELGFLADEHTELRVELRKAKDILERELGGLEQRLHLAESSLALAAENEAGLNELLAAALKDAERYRFLRNQSQKLLERQNLILGNFENELDASIDHAMAQKE